MPAPRLARMRLLSVRVTSWLLFSIAVCVLACSSPDNWFRASLGSLDCSAASAEAFWPATEITPSNVAFWLLLKSLRMASIVDVSADRLIWTVFARSEEHTSELQSLMRISYAVFCLKKKKNKRMYRYQH